MLKFLIDGHFQCIDVSINFCKEYLNVVTWHSNINLTPDKTEHILNAFLRHHVQKL